MAPIKIDEAPIQTRLVSFCSCSSTGVEPPNLDQHPGWRLSTHVLLLTAHDPGTGGRKHVHIISPPWILMCLKDTQHIPKTYGGFHKWGYPPIIHFKGIFPYKPSILGYPLFWKPPFSCKAHMGDSQTLQHLHIYSVITWAQEKMRQNLCRTRAGGLNVRKIQAQQTLNVLHLLRLVRSSLHPGDMFAPAWHFLGNVLVFVKLQSRLSLCR